MAWKRTDKELLRVNRYPKATQHCIDYDYLDKLSEKDLHWLAEFTDMIYNNHNGTKFFNIEDPGYMKKVYRETNARNSDLYQRMLKGGLLDSLDEDTDEKLLDLDKFS